MGKRKRGIGCKENETSNFYSVDEDIQQSVENKKICTPLTDICVTGESFPGTGGSLSLDSNEISNTNVNFQDDPPVPPTSDARPTLQLRTSVRVQNKRKEENRCEASNEILLKKADICSQDEEEDDNGSKAELTDGEVKKRRRAWEVWSMEVKDFFFEAINDCGKDFEAIQNFVTTKLKKKVNIEPKNKDQVRHFYYRTWHKISKYVNFSQDINKATQELYALINYGELRRKVGGTLDEKKGQKLQELIQKGSASLRRKGKSIRVRTPICRALKKLNQFADDGCFRVPTYIYLTLTAGNLKSWTHVQNLAHNPRVRIKCALHKQLSSIFSVFEHKWRSQEMKICEHLTSSLAVPFDPPTKNRLTLRLMPQMDADIKLASFEADTQMTSRSLSLENHEKYLKSNDFKFTTATHRKARKRKTLTDSHKSIENRQEIDIDSQDDGSDGDVDSQNKSPSLQTENGPPLEDNHSSNIDIIELVSAHSEYVSRTRTDSLSSESNDKDSGGCNDQKSVKEEQIDSPMEIQIEGNDNPTNVVVKEETDVLRELMALQNVVNPHESDGDVIFIGENSRLQAQIRDQAKTSDGNEAIEAEGSAAKWASDEEDHISLDQEKTTSNEDDHISLDQEKTTSNEDLSNNIEEIRKGWTNSTCGSIKLGELYLMFGKKKTLSLEYFFEEDVPSVDKISSDVSVICDKKIESTENDACCSAESNFGNVDSDSIVKEPKLNPLQDEKYLARKELSEVLERLVTMVKSFSTKTPVGDCGFCGTSKTSSAAKSPASSRSSAYGRSPSHARSPRVSGSSRSPKNGAINPKACDEKSKPTSAKRLLAPIPEEMEESSADLKLIKEGKKILAAVEKPIQPKIAVDPTGGFLIPLAPAPRVATSNSGFNAQLSKLMPKYSRPRRINRKNMVVQRQLPLLPPTSKESVGFITLKILPHTTDGSITTSQADRLLPVLQNTATPNVELDSGTIKEVVSSISMPIISDTSSSIPNSTAISVNVSGQQLLSVKMPTFTAETVCSANVLADDITTTSMRKSDAAVSASKSVHTNLEGDPTGIADFDMDKILSKSADETKDLITPPRTPICQSEEFGEDVKFNSEMTCSTPVLPELKDISFLELTPHNSPAKSKFTLSPLNGMSDNSNVSLLNTPKQFDSKAMLCVSPIKLNLSSILNSAAMIRAGFPVSEPDIPEIHIPETNDSLPLLDMSIDGTTSLNNQPIDALNFASISNLNLKSGIDTNKSMVDSDKEKKMIATKLMDITFANSNSNSSFSTLLAAVGQSVIEMESSETLQTPPRSAKFQPANATKKDSNAPFGLSFKANLFTSDYPSTLPITTPSPPSSPSRLLQQTDNSQWLNNEVNDFSLSEILCHLESPAKTSNSLKMATKDDSSSLLSFLTDNSVDYAATFAKFKAQIAKDNRNE